uniref:O-fucosyltransferase family protein n=1 Tax=Ditylum brightwellii TaxID=49249 RepID=A0A6U3RDY2_9STRA|mmetsp:Transcript_26884/g.39943  ORF Transcript_26884/g.39943 Transcript_26884/m.39943 type:complete len:364 (+) Transcript_26884:547-1638(+)
MDSPRSYSRGKLIFLLVVLLSVRILFQGRIIEKNTVTIIQDEMRSDMVGKKSSLSLASPMPLQNNETSSMNQTPINVSTNQSNFDKTLALLYPPGMWGGYGNQRIRFTAFVRYAISNGITQLLLPSIYFSTMFENDVFYPIPMEEVFDVDHWNSFQGDLPILVQSLQNDEKSDCWTNSQHEHPSADDLQATIERFAPALNKEPKSGVQYVPSKMLLEVANRSNFLTPLVNLSVAITTGLATLGRPGKIGLHPDDLKCSNPLVYGGGGGAGILWNDFVSKIRTNEADHMPLMKSISQALKPAQKWQEIAQQCLQNQHQSTNSHLPPIPYFALHMRVELDMWHHKCGRDMEKNLSKYIFELQPDH